MTAQIILQMIETVSPDDTAKLDEIEGRIYMYLYRAYPHYGTDETDGTVADLHDWRNTGGHWCSRKKCKCNTEADMLDDPPKYTRSRDALKAIRPEGWQFKLVHDAGADIWAASLTKWGPNSVPIKMIPLDFEWPYKFKTEELAELHAIIQALAYERSNDQTD